MDVNDDAGNLKPNGVFRFFASKLAPTKNRTELRILPTSFTEAACINPQAFLVNVAICDRAFCFMQTWSNSAILERVMALRQELMPPHLCETKVARLANLAAQIDGANQDQTRDQLAQFNREAMTDLTSLDFPGIDEAQDHDTWVRQILMGPYERRLKDISQPEMIEMARRVMDADIPEHATCFWLQMLALNIPDARISDLFIWPGEYFSDGDDARELIPEQVIETALKNDF
ncbi:hypothetical protein [Pseudomonas umsongensis]